MGIRLRVVSLCAVAVCGLASLHAAPKLSTPTVRTGGKVYRISGPYAYRNLTVFLLHSGAKDSADYLTLQEGLTSGLVRIAEKDREQVSELVISNNSDRPLFLQEGDRVIGGKQDRIISSSLVIPPHCNRVPLPAFCVEHGRWTAGSSGKAFGVSSEAAVAPLSVRRAAKVANSQSEVWDNVAKEKAVAGTVASAPSATTSLSEAMDSAGFRKVADQSVKRLEGAVAKQPDSVGVAIAVNGRIEEVNIYPSHSLLARLYPRLLRSYALEAAQRSGQRLAAKMKRAAVAEFVNQRRYGSAVKQQIDARNSLSKHELSTAVEMQTNYGGAAVHQQFMRK